MSGQRFYKLPEGLLTYIYFKDPITGELEYSRQTGPIYGEAGAPVRWQDTLAPWMVSQGYTRGCNDQAMFYDYDKDVLALTFVDDLLYDTEADGISEATVDIETRFDCKGTE